MDQNELIHEIGTKLVDDIGGRKANWAHIVLVGRAHEGAVQMNGFIYLSDGEHESVSPHNFDVLDDLTALRILMSDGRSEEPWRACLIRIDRSTMEINFEFEYQDVDRWTITPQNVEQKAAELKPRK